MKKHLRPKASMQPITAIKTDKNIRTARSQEDEINQARTLIV